MIKDPLQSPSQFDCSKTLNLRSPLSIIREVRHNNDIKLTIMKGTVTFTTSEHFFIQIQ